MITHISKDPNGFPKDLNSVDSVYLHLSVTIAENYLKTKCWQNRRGYFTLLHCKYVNEFCCLHWRSSHYAVEHVRIKNSNTQGRPPNVVKVILSYHKELL